MNVQCPKCAESFDVPDDSTKCSCPKCGQPIEFADAVPEPYKQQTDKITTDKSHSVLSFPPIVLICATILCVVFFMQGCDQIGSGNFYWPGTERNARFRTDNSYGATANAAEYIAANLPEESPAPWFICGLLCALIISVERLRYEIKLQNRS